MISWKTPVYGGTTSQPEQIISSVGSFHLTMISLGIPHEWSRYKVFENYTFEIKAIYPGENEWKLICQKVTQYIGVI